MSLPPAHRIAHAGLWAVFVAYALTWTAAHRGWLTDPMLQNDDARTTLFPFHGYGPEHALRGDPVTEDMAGYIPPAQRLIYRALTPVVGLHVASKIVQLACLGLIVCAGVIVARSRRAGPAAALLLVFVLLHTPYVVNRMGGGHMRGFAFGVLALWIAGAMTGRTRPREVAAVASALLYPPAMILLLGAEGLFALRGLPEAARPVIAARIRRFAILAGICGLIIVPQVILSASHGHMHTLAEARQDPVFASGPRDILPFVNPVVCSVRHLAHPLHANGSGLLAGAWAATGIVGPVLVLVAVAALAALKQLPGRWTVAALLGSAAVSYAVARVLAFRLYNPDRYLTYGMVAAALALLVVALKAARPAWRPALACAAMCLMWTVAGDGAIRRPDLAGDGVVSHNGMSIDRRADAALYDFVETLPANTRIAMHPMDGAGITYWTGRATTEHFETLQPWLVEPWHRLRARTVRTMQALYATDPDELLAYCAEREVTHLLVHAGRYGDDFARRAGFFAPFDRIAARIVAGVRREDLAIPRVTSAGTVVFHGPPWIVLDVARVRAMLAAQRQANVGDSSEP